MQYSIHIVEEGRDEEPHTSLDDINDPLFKQYVEAASQHVLAKFPEASGGQAAADEHASVELWFVHRPLLGPAATSAAVPLDNPPPAGAGHLDSPWVRLAVTPPPACSVRGVFIWSERQFLRDQAVMDGAEVSPSGPPSPIAGPEFAELVEDYTDSILRAPRDTRAEALAEIADRIPPDLLWLFRQSWQSTRGPFGGMVNAAMKEVLQRISGPYIELTKSLVDRGFALANNNGEQRYQSVGELSEAYSVEQYRIDRLH